jgi:tetratricopeptide (TPR) repeat protein
MKRCQFINHLRNLLLCTSLTLALGVAGCRGRSEVATRLGTTAQQQLESGQIDLAKQTIKRAIRERDDIADLHVLRGRIELAAKDPVKALDAYSDALALNKTNMEALQAAAQLGLQNGRFRVAEDAADRILALTPDDPNAMLVLGLLRMVTHRNDEALDYADRILAKDPANEPANILRARALYLSGKPDEAMAQILKVVPVTGPTEGESLTLLELYRERGDSGKMLEQFAYLRKLRPDDFALHADEANLLYKLGNVAAARSLAGRTFLRAGNNLSQGRIAIALLREYDRTPFTDDQLRTLASQATTVGLVELARFYLDTGQPEKLTLLFGNGNSNDGKALLSRAAVAQGQQKTGLALAESVLAKDKTQCDALLARAEFWLQVKQADAALRDAAQAQVQCPRIVGGWLIQARGYMAKNDVFGVRHTFEQATTANPQDSMLTGAFANWLVDRKEGQRGASAVHRLVRASPASLSAWRLYRDICTKIGDKSCLAEANRGFNDALKILGTDPPKGERPPAGLFGRMRKL